MIGDNLEAKPRRFGQLYDDFELREIFSSTDEESFKNNLSTAIEERKLERIILPDESFKYKFVRELKEQSSITSNINSASIIQNLNRHLNNHRTLSRQLQILVAQADSTKVDDLENLVTKWEEAGWKVFLKIYEQYKESGSTQVHRLRKFARILGIDYEMVKRGGGEDEESTEEEEEEKRNEELNSECEIDSDDENRKKSKFVYDD